MPGPKVPPKIIALLRRLALKGKTAQVILEQIGDNVSIRTIYRYLDEMGLVKKQPRPNRTIPTEMREVFRQFVVAHSQSLHPEEIRDLWNNGPGAACPVSHNQVVTRQRECNCLLSIEERAALPYLEARRTERRNKAELRQTEAKKAYREALQALQKQMLKTQGEHTFERCPKCGTNWLLTQDFFPHYGHKYVELLTDFCLACENEKGINRRLTKEQLQEFQTFLRTNAQTMHPEEIAELWNERYYKTLQAPRVSRTVVDLWLKRLDLRLSQQELAALPYTQELNKKAIANHSAKLREVGGKRRARIVLAHQEQRDAQLAAGTLQRSDLAICSHCGEAWPKDSEHFYKTKYRSRKTSIESRSFTRRCKFCNGQQIEVIQYPNPKLIARWFRCSQVALLRNPQPKQTAEDKSAAMHRMIAQWYDFSLQSLERKLPEKTVRKEKQPVVMAPGVSSRYLSVAFRSAQKSLERREKKAVVRKEPRKRIVKNSTPTLFSLMRTSFEACNAALRRELPKDPPPYTNGKCVFCGKLSRRLLLLPGRESRGPLCPKCFEKVSAMSDERLAILDQLMQQHVETAQRRKERRKKQERTPRPKINRNASRSRYDDDDAFLDLFD